MRVKGATGRTPAASYKLGATLADGFRNTFLLILVSEQAVHKARRTGTALLTRMDRTLVARSLPAFTETQVEVLRGEEVFGA